MGKRSFLLLSLTWLLILVVPLAHAAVVQKLSIEDMAKEAGFILEGKVLSSRCEWNAGHDQIYTFVEINVHDVHKGSYERNTLHLRILGGVVDGLGMLIPGSPRFIPGSEIVLFLGPNPQSLFPVVGLSQGNFVVLPDQQTGQKRATNPAGLSMKKSELKTRIDRALTR